jgi:hypothetical protein
MASFASPLEEPSIRAEIKIFETNEREVTATYNEVYNLEIAECDTTAKTYWRERRGNTFKRKCKSEARDNHREAITDHTVSNLKRELTTENEAHRKEIVEIIRKDENQEIYSTMQELREIAQDEQIKQKIQELRKISNVGTIFFKLSASLTPGYNRLSHGNVSVVIGTNRPSTVYSLYPQNNDDGDYFYIGEVSTLRTILSNKEKINNYLGRYIKSLEEKAIKNDGLEDIVDDFSSLEEEHKNRFI